MATAVASRVSPAKGILGTLAVAVSVGRLHIVSIGALGALTFGWVFFDRRMPVVALAAAIDWFLVNLLNRVVDIPEDEKNGIVGTSFVARHRSTITVVGFALLVGTLVGGHLLAPALLPYRVGFHALGLAYNWRLLPGKRRIKQLYFWKNTASAVGFVLTVFAYPLVHGLSLGASPRTSPLGILLVGAFFVLFELSYEVFYDLRDAPGDRAEGIATYAVVHGERGALRIATALVVASLVVVVAGYVAGAVPWRVVAMVAAPLVQLATSARAVRRLDRGEPPVSANDCITLTWIGAAMFVAYNLWAFFGLPGV
ncbi:MAG: UbiA family prenyltransferase [Deltaproteobacteria bacterium]|nr:UbiA family prenyltransferase [Deltaproteobacteria bacterium]